MRRVRTRYAVLSLLAAAAIICFAIIHTHEQVGTYIDLFTFVSLPQRAPLAPSWPLRAPT